MPATGRLGEGGSGLSSSGPDRVPIARRAGTGAEQRTTDRLACLPDRQTRRFIPADSPATVERPLINEGGTDMKSTVDAGSWRNWPGQGRGPQDKDPWPPRQLRSCPCLAWPCPPGWVTFPPVGEPQLRIHLLHSKKYIGFIISIYFPSTTGKRLGPGRRTGGPCMPHTIPLRDCNHSASCGLQQLVSGALVVRVSTRARADVSTVTTSTIGHHGWYIW